MGSPAKHVWITRTEPGAQLLGEALNRAGYAAWCAPTLQVHPLDPPRAYTLQLAQAPIVQPGDTSSMDNEGGQADVSLLDQSICGLDDILLHPSDLVIVLSAHAATGYVELLAQLVSNVKIRSYPHIAIGDKTNSVIKAHIQNSTMPKLQTSEGILQMDRIRQLGSANTVWILGGVGGRETLPIQLLRRYACRVIKLEFYQRVALNPGKIDTARVAAIMVGSVQGLQNTAQYWQAAGGSLDIPLIAVSRRIAQLAQSHGFQRVINAAGADANSIINALNRAREADPTIFK